MPVFRAAFAAGVTYLDMAMSLSHPHPTEPYRLPGSSSGRAVRYGGPVEGARSAGPLWHRVEPGLSDVFARYAADNLFSSIDEIGVRDGANLVVEGTSSPVVLHLDHDRGVPEPADHLGAGQGLVHDGALQRAETFTFPAGIGPVECVNVSTRRCCSSPAGSMRSG